MNPRSRLSGWFVAALLGALVPAVGLAQGDRPQSEDSGHAEMDHSKMDHGEMDPGEMDHSKMDHDQMDPGGMDPGEMDHGQMDPGEMDHSKMDHGQTDPGEMDHSKMDHSQMDHGASQPRTPIPPVTDADRAAAVPPQHAHAVHDNSIHSFTLIDRFEAWDSDAGTAMEWEAMSWIGTDLNRVWLRSEGERDGGVTESADLEVLYGRSIARWWDVVVGVRHDFKPGASQTFAAFGVMGLAPQKFEVEATAYVGESGQTGLRFEIERDLLFTGRLVLQPLVEAEFFGRNDAARGIGSGLSTLEAGLRLRYEIRREIAPYIGLVREWSFGRTADFRRDDDEPVNDTRVVAGIRLWF